MATGPYDKDVWDRAHWLYVEEGLSHREVSEATGISESSLVKRGAKEKWLQERRRTRTYREKVKQLKHRLVDKALASDSVTEGEAYKALCLLQGLEKSFREPGEREGTERVDRPALYIEFFQELIGFIRERDPRGMRVLEKHFSPFMDDVKARYAA